MQPREYCLRAESDAEIPYDSQAFQRHIQAALLLSLLERGLLTRLQFDRCLAEVQRNL